jgi:TP901 family phage tail tape measure protein
VLSALTRIQNKSSLTLNTRNFTQPLGQITGLANEFNKSLEASNARVVAFGASAGVIFAVQKSFSALVNTTIDVEKSLTDINIVLNTSSAGIKKFGDQLFEVAKNTGSSFKDAAGAATEFSRQGLGLEETLRRTRDALILTRLSGLDVVSSTEALTSAVNSFTKEALTTTDVVNKLAAVDAKFAVSSRDLSEAIQRVGSSASEAGVSFDELLGIVTSVQQTTARGGAVIGNALKTIFTRIERPQVIDDLKDFGIAVTDISGNALPTIKIIENLAQSFQNLNPVVKSQVAELVGGVYQINILKAALADVSKQNSAFAEATKASSQAVDDAIVKNDALNQSLSALFNATTANFAKFAVSIGESSVAPGIRKVLDYVNSALESYNEKDSESIGKKIATGLLTGITSFVTGPGLALGALAVGKLIGNFASFAGDATKNILGLNSLGRQQAVLQGEISNILSSNPQLIQQIISGSKSRLQVEKEIKQTLIEQAAVSEMLKKSSASIAYGYIASGLGVSTSGSITGRRGSAGGYIPAQQQASEMVGAMQGGYAPGKVVAAPKSIGGVMNTAEKVKYIPGFAQPYILPPQGSRAAQSLASKSMAKNGINPYMAKGFVPNFGPMALENDTYGYGDNEWLRRASRDPVPLSQIRLDPKYEAAFDPSRPKGERFYRKDGAPFTGNDLNHFVRAGAKYGEIRAEMPESILMADPRFKKGLRKGDTSAITLDDIRKDFAPGRKIEGESTIKEEIRRVYEPYSPPASMLVFDLDEKNKEIFADKDTGKIEINRKEGGRAFKIKSYALNASALNEERTGLIQKTEGFARKVTKDVASYIRPGEYSDFSVDEFFKKTGKNYNVLAGTIFEASANLAANYTRDENDTGGDFDVRGGSIGNVRELFPGFADQYGDYKLKNNDDALRSFIGKVKGQFKREMAEHFIAQEIKGGSVTSGLKTNSSGFIPNFAPKPFNFRFSSLGEKTAQISPKLRDWLADKYFDPEMASTGTLERLASLNRDSGAFFSSLENPNAVAGIPVRGQQGFVSRQNRGARAGAFLNALRARLPDFVPGSLPNLASGFIPNFLKPKKLKIKSFKTGEGERVLGPTAIVNKQTREKFIEKVLAGHQDQSYIRYSKKDDSIDVDFVRSSRRGDGGMLWDRAGNIAKQFDIPLTTSAFIPQIENLEKYDAETNSFGDVLSTGFPQLKWSERGKAKNTKLNVYNDHSQYPVDSKRTFSDTQSLLNNIYKYNAPSLKDSILSESTYIRDIVSYFAKGHVPNFAEGEMSSLSKLGFLLKTSSIFSSLINPMDVMKLMSGKGSFESVFKPLVPLMKTPSKYIKSKGELESTKTVLKMLYSSDILGERAANFLARIVPETNFNALDAGQAAERDATYQEYGEKEAYSPHDSYLKYRLFGGKKSLLEYNNKRDLYDIPKLLENPDKTYRFNEANEISKDDMEEAVGSAANVFGKNRPPPSTQEVEKLLERKGKGGKFLGYTFKMGRFIGDLGRTRRAVRYTDPWDLNLHQNENWLLDEYFAGKLSKEEVNAIIDKQSFKENYAGSLDSLMLRDLVSVISNPATLKGIVKIPKDQRFSKGHIPNFNAVQEAIGREMSAGYSSSQVKVGQSSKLKTNFNPMGLGVYNSTEGSLNGGIGLAEKAGINPKTKGMSAKGHIPNFAEFGGTDFSIAIGALALFATSIKSSMDSFNNLKEALEVTKKTNADAAKAYEAELKKGSGTITKEFAAREKLIQDEIKKTFTNVNNKLKLTGTSTGPLVRVPPVRGSMVTSSSAPRAASAEEVARLAELREQRAANRKEKLARQEAAKTGKAEAEAALSLASASALDPKTMFKLDSKFSNRARAVGTPVGLALSAISNVGGQFVSPENKTGKAYASGIGDVASFAGLGAQFGAPGVIVGAVIGIGSMLVKLKDAKAEEAIDKINKSLDETKQKSSDFSGAAQNYATSLEGLLSALNDPKTKPEALLKFQNNITEALSSIPDEFRNKVLQAGTDITKYSEAIAGVNKELGNTQKNLERQLAITNLIKEESSLFGSASVSKKNQKTLNALFSSSVDPESVTKNFQGGSATKDLNTFFENLKKETTFTRDVYSGSGGMTAGVKIGEVTDLDKSSVESVKSKLKDKGLLSGLIADLLDDAFGKLDLAAITSIINAIQNQGSAIIDNAKRAKILAEILDVNTKRIIANAEALKALNEQFNDINLQISNQIDIEKNRGKTIREINKIQAEGVVSTQRARVKGALDAFAPFVGEGTKNNIQNQLDTNEINTRQNSQIRDATSKLLDSLSDSITKKVEEARGKIVPAIEGATGIDNIQKQRAVFQRQIDLLTPVVTQGLKGINETGKVSDTRGSLIRIIQENAGMNKAFTKEASELLIQSLDVSFNEFKNELAKIKAQGDIDLEIQTASREYQKQSLAINQRLSFAGGAQALSSTGKTGVSDLFDSLSELVSEFRQTNAIGSAAQKGSTSFKFLDILTNQLQLNRATEAPVPYKDAQSFNKQVSSDLNPLAATAIAGRVQQIRESLDLAKNVTEIQTGKSTEGTALGKAFDMAKEGAVKTALDQIASQFKLENMGNYLDVLQQEARYLNDLTLKQNKLLESALPTSINNNFKEVIESKVGVRLDTLTSSLTGAINKLATSTKRGTVETDIANKLPSDIPPQKRADLLKRIQDSGELKPTPLTTPTTAGQKGVDELKKKNQEELNKYSQALAAVLKDKERMSSGSSSYESEEAVKYINEIRAKYNIDGTSEELSAKQVRSRQSEVEASQQSYVNNRTNQVDFTKLDGTTYKEFVDKANQDFGTSITEETVKSIKPLLAERRKLDVQDLLSSPPPLPSDSPDSSKRTNKSVLAESTPTELAKGRADLDRGREANKARNVKELAALNEEVEILLAQKNKNAEQEARLLKKQIELREKGLQVENDNAKYNFDLYYKKGYGKKFFKDERAAFANAEIESEARQGNVDIGAITEKNTTYNRADFAKDTGQLIDTFQTDFKSGIASAFGEAIKGTKNLKDAFRDMFQGILNRMLDKSLEMGVDALFAFGKAFATGRKDGGPIKGYNSGGMVTGGSGMKDDVPAMMSGGEYVIKKSSVDKYGSDYLRNLNGGIIPRYATGGFSVGPLQNEFLYDNPDRPTSGEYAVDSRLSAAALTDDSNPQNKLRQDRYEKLDQYLQDRAQYERDKKQSLKNYKDQVNSTFYSGLTAAGIQLASAGLTMGAEKLRTQGYAGTTAGRLESGVGTSPEMMTTSNGRATMPRRRAFGGSIAKFAGGGSTGQDNIPALLMGGEYVMNKKAVDLYGKDFMGQLNSGSLPKYARGGMVGASYSGQSNTDQSSSVDELVTALNTLNDNLSKDSGITQSESGRSSLAGATQESGMSVVNNISINVAQSGEVSSEANSNTQKGSSNSKNNQNSIENNGKLAELLKSKVVEVLIEQKRPGGLLYSSR